MCRSTSIGYELVKILIENNLNTINAQDKNGKIPLLIDLSLSEKIDQLDVQLLINNGANLNNQDNYGNTPLHNACNIRSLHGAIRILIDNCADINISNNDGWIPLIVLCNIGIFSGKSFEALELLVVNGAEMVDVTNRYGDNIISNILKYSREEYKLRIANLLSTSATYTNIDNISNFL